MAHDHSHAEEKQAYFLDQLCTIGICGALGAIMILLNRAGALSSILHPKFHDAVLLGGIGLLILVVVRSVAVWFASASPAHEHNHDHGPEHEREDCDHAHGDHDHAHGHEHEHAHEHAHDPTPGDDHGHTHGWAPWRYAVLLLPVVLYFLNIPGRAGEEEKYNDNISTLDFKEVERAGNSKDERDRWEEKDKKGEKGRLKGKFFLMSTRKDMFRLVREKVTCCAADAVPLNVPLKCAEDLVRPEELQGRWVSVVGKVKFTKVGEEWFPYFEVDKAADVKKMKGPDPNPFIF